MGNFYSRLVTTELCFLIVYDMQYGLIVSKSAMKRIRASLESDKHVATNKNAGKKSEVHTFGDWKHTGYLVNKW